MICEARNKIYLVLGLVLFKVLCMRKYYKKKKYWEALITVRLYQFTLTPKYMYKYWRDRLDLIKKNII